MQIPTSMSSSYANLGSPAQARSTPQTPTADPQARVKREQQPAQSVAEQTNEPSQRAQEDNRQMQFAPVEAASETDRLNQDIAIRESRSQGTGNSGTDRYQQMAQQSDMASQDPSLFRVDVYV